MKLCKVSDIVGNEKLARPIMTSNYQELLAAGTILKPEYIQKIKQLGIVEIYIQDEKLKPEQVEILRDEVKDEFKTKVKSVMERHIYSNSSDLEELSKTADGIITNILSRDEVIEQIYDFKERTADVYEHSISVCSLAVLIAIKLKLDKSIIHDLGVACIFHDIGLRYIDFEYTDVEIESLEENKKIEYRKHPANAYAAMNNESWISNKSKMMILSHHERMDGSGYPLHITNIPPESQILQVCDAFDEMICGIGCKRTRVYEAVEFLKFSKNILFSERIVNTLLEFTAVYPAGTLVVLNTKEVAVVVKQNKQFPERPVLNIIRDKDGNALSESIQCDLLESNNKVIEKVLH